MTKVNLTEPPDDGMIIEQFEESFSGLFEDFDERGTPEVIDHDCSERKSQMQVICRKWINWP